MTYTVKARGTIEVEADSAQEAIDKFYRDEFHTLDYDEVECGGISEIYGNKDVAKKV